MSVKGEAQRARYEKEAKERVGTYIFDKLRCYKYRCVAYVGTTGGTGPRYEWLCPLCEKGTFVQKYRDIAQGRVVKSCSGCAAEAKSISMRNSVARNAAAKERAW